MNGQPLQYNERCCVFVEKEDCRCQNKATTSIGIMQFCNEHAEKFRPVMERKGIAANDEKA